MILALDQHPESDAQPFGKGKSTIDNRKFAFQNCEPCEDFVWTLFYPCDSTVQRRETQFNDVLRDDMHLKYDNFEVFEI